ncbi:hypothetical protein Bca101_003837 [Brassica carinata]
MDHSSTKAGKWCHSWCYRGVSVSHGHQHFVRKDVNENPVMDEYLRQVSHANFELDDVFIVIFSASLPNAVRLSMFFLWLV